MNTDRFAETRYFLLTAFLLFAALCIAPRTAHADFGQCRWENGPGDPTYPNCKLQDCIGNGGLAQCTEPEIKPPASFTDAQVDGEKFSYNACEGTPLTGLYCQAAGGTWNGFNGHPPCAGLGAGYIGSAEITNSEGLAISTSDTFASLIACPKGSPTDTGWTSLSAANCYPGPLQYSNGILIRAARLREWPYQSPCTGTLRVEYLKTRSVVCPIGFSSRLKPNGQDLHCFIPAECCETKVGNPVSLITGAKHQEEFDYRSAGVGGLEFKRYYNSRGFFRVPGVVATVPQLNDYWRHSYQRELYSISGNPNLMAILRREDGTLRHFDGAGKEVLNRGGAAARLQFIAGTGWKLTLANYDVERYDLTGKFTSITTRAGIVTTVNYDTSGRVSSVVNSFGHALTFDYDTSSRLSTVTNAASGAIQYGYDSAGRLETATYPDLKIRRYHYEDPVGPQLLSGITDENNVRFSTYTYNSNGQVITTQHAGGAERIDLSYGSANINTVNTNATDALGVNRGMALDNQNGVYKKRIDFRSVAGDGPKDNQLSYDTQGNITQRMEFPVGPNSFRNVTTYEYDLTRNLETSRTEGKNQFGATAVTRTITTQWHATYRLPTQISVYAGATATGTPLRITNFTHDASGNVLTKTITDTSVMPNVTRTWTYTYNGFGQVLTENGPRTDLSDITIYTYYNCTTGFECGQVNTITNALNQITTYNAYNAHGQPLTITDSNGVVTTLAYDARQRLTSKQVGSETTTFEYWPTGLLKKVTLPDTSFLLHTYDDAHRLFKIEDGQSNRIQYTLDAMGNRTAENVYDPSSALTRTRTRVFNSVNQLWKEIGAAGTTAVTTEFLYDNNGNQTNVNAPLSRNTVNTYDELNRLKQNTDPGSGNTTFAYDANDNLISVTDPRSLATSYTYNGFGDRITQVSPDTGTSTNTYDSGGNLKTSTDARNAITTFVYDALNRPTSAAFKIGSTTDQTITYTYDVGTNGKGRLTGASDASHSISWTYDVQGRVTGKGQTVGTITKSVGYGYANGNQTSLITPSGQTVTYGYSNRQISSITINGTALLSSVLYEPLGPVRQWTWGNGALMARTRDLDGRIAQIDSKEFYTYAYDDAFRITGITNVDNSALSWTYGYNALDRLTSATKTGTTLGWTYDATGNRLSQTGSSAQTYTVNAASNRLSSISGAVTRTYSYNAAGNTTGYSNIVFAYNNRGRVKSATVGGTASNYVYNALGQLVKKSGGGGTTLFMYDEAGHLVGEYNSTGGLVQETVWLGDIPVATLRPNGASVSIYYVHADHLSTPRKITRPSDNKMRWRWDPDAFGNGSPNQNPESLGAFTYNLRFPGQVYFSETSLNYNYMRNYEPISGRYIESDPIGLRGGVNTYAYVLNNPTSNIDSFGLYCTKDFVGHYYFGGGGTIDLSSIGLLNQFQNSASVRAAVSQFHSLLKGRGLERARELCAGKESGTVSDIFVEVKDTVTNVTSDNCLFSVGQSSFFRSAGCLMNADCCTREFSMSCSSAFGIRDWFRDPLSRGFEVGGTPYQINASWGESLSHRGKF